jgi:hypothetical protein
MEGLDLDINNYTINDIEKFFKFRPKSTYSASDVELREAQIREQLLQSGHVKGKYKRDLMAFLTEAKEWLVEARCPQTRPPTTLGKDYPHDGSPYPHTKHLPSPPGREGELTSRPETQYIYTQDSQFLPGNMNPLKTRVISKCLTIDTRFRDNYNTTNSTDFTFQMPLKLNKVVSMQMSSFEIPVSFYGISASYGNNFLFISITYPNPEYDDEPIQEFKVFIVPDGNYNAQDFVDKINDMVCPKNFDGTSKYPDDLFSYITFVLDITESGSGTGKVTLGTTGMRGCEITKISLDFTRDINGDVDSVDISSKIGWNLGFTQKYYDNKTKYVADTLIEPATIRYIYLAVDDFNNSVNNHFITAFNKSILNPNILARISIKGTYFSLLMENDLSIVTEPRTYFGPVDIQRLRIRLFDDHGRILEMNNANFSFCLVFKLLYDL